MEEFQTRKLGWLIIPVSLIVIGFGMMLMQHNVAAESAEFEPLALGEVERVSVGTGGVEANGSSFHAAPSHDGRYVGFISYADNWYDEDNSQSECLPSMVCVDVFVRDREADITHKLTIGYDGMTANDSSYEPYLSADGSLVTFNSFAENLVPGDNNGDLPVQSGNGLDTFLWSEGQPLRRISLKANGDEIPGDTYGVTAADESVTYFSTDRTGIVEGVSVDAGELYRRDLATGAVTHVPITFNGQPVNGAFWHLNTDAAGRYLIMTSYATNLVAGDTNGEHDVFLFDTETATMEIVSRSMNGGYPNHQSGAPQISPDGTYVVFKSDASDLVPGDTNGVADGFIYEIATGNIERFTVGPNGEEANGLSKDPAVCENGRFVAFTSDASNIIPNDINGERDVFVIDRETGRRAVATRSDDGVWGNGQGHKSTIVADCSAILFASEADNLIDNDTNGERDLFYRALFSPADISTSGLSAVGSAETGSTIEYTLHLANTGGDEGFVTVDAPIPAGTTYVPDSATGNIAWSNATNSMVYGTVLERATSETLTFAIQLSDTLTTSNVVSLEATVTLDGTETVLRADTIINALKNFLPLIAR